MEHVLAMCPKYSNARAALAQTLENEIKDEAAGNARKCAEGGKMVCPAGYPTAIQHGEGDRREKGGRRLYPIPAVG